MFLMMMMMMIIIIIMLMGRDCVSKLRPPTGLLFIPKAIYNHGEPWCNTIERRKLLVRPPELSGIPPAE
jgi:hypothetical protein